MKARILYLIFLIIWVYSCEDVVDLNLPEKNKRLVVEGLITNENTVYIVKLSNTSKYSFKYDTSKVEYERGATVIISDNSGNNDTLNEISPGIYQTHPDHIIGVIGRSYKINVLTQGGNRYESIPEEMADIPRIDSIYFDRDYNDVNVGPGYRAFRYTVYIDWQDPPNVTNYYLRILSSFWNNTWHTGGRNRLQVLDDRTFNGLYLKKYVLESSHANVYFRLKVKQYSLTKSSYDFWNLASQQLFPNGNGIVNSSVPLFGNVHNVNDQNDFALGYFQVSAVDSAEVYVNR